jgi:hypothetical protein
MKIKIKKTLKIVGLVLLIMVILILALLPFGTKNYAIKNSKTLVGRKIDIGKLKLNYFTGTVKLIDFKMFEADDVTEFISLDSLIINTEPYHYISNEIVIEQFFIKGLTVNVIQQDSTFNFDDLLAFFTSETDTSNVQEENAKSFKYKLSNLELKGANFSYNDKNICKI